MQQTVLKIVKILAYQCTISEKDREELVKIAGEEGLFLGQKKMPKVDDTPVEKNVISDSGIKARTWNGYVIQDSGIKACTWNDKVFYFYTDVQGEVENAMMLMGYDTHGYWLFMFNNIEEPLTPVDFKYKEKDNEKT